ncbi:hypothetical protein Pfo_027217 [Paulownia fortunei]|nr:hypothetical protein Pfo_027217 [Paulownia fortunei]
MIRRSIIFYLKIETKKKTSTQTPSPDPHTPCSRSLATQPRSTTIIVATNSHAKLVPFRQPPIFVVCGKGLLVMGKMEVTVATMKESGKGWVASRAGAGLWFLGGGFWHSAGS